MSKITEIETEADRKWLLSVHLRHVTNLLWFDFEVAALYGNEDAPQKVELLKQNHYRCVPRVFIANDEGILTEDPAASIGHGRLRPKTTRERKARCL